MLGFLTDFLFFSGQLWTSLDKRETSHLHSLRLNGTFRIIDFLSSNSMNDNSKVAVLLSLQDGVPTAGGLGTSADGVMKMAGLNNVFSDFEGWKPVASESMIEQNPEFIFMPARSVKSNGGIEQILKNPIISLTDAGRNGNVFEVDGMALLGFGPRTISVARQLSEQVAGSDRE